MKLIDYDEYEVALKYMGLNVIGEHAHEYIWRFKFPEATTAALNLNLFMPVRFTTEVFDREDFHHDIHNELQKEIEKQLKDNEKARIVIQLLFGDALVLN